jgi:hypothetical protein
MKVNRTRFLLLTAALAGGVGVGVGAGCTVNDTTNNGTDGGTQGDATGGDDSATGDSATGDSATGDSATDGGTEAATCDDTTGSAPDCAALVNSASDGGVNDGGTSCATNAAFATVCAAWVANLKSKVATNAANCAVALPSCESGAGLDTCLSAALNMSCADPTADAVCMSISATCADAGVTDAGISTTQCDTYVSGLNPTGRTALQACFTEGMCASDFGTCIATKFLP